MNQETAQKSATCDIMTAFQQASGKWSGCQWPTRFGALGLNLDGLKSSQAVLMARSTAGREAAEWRAAVQWLEQVESDAREAENEASIATSLAAMGHYAEALEHAGRACHFEAEYKSGLVWKPLWNAIAEMVH